MKHAGRIIKTLFAVLLVAVPAVLVDPSFKSYVAAHPWVSSSLPLALAAVRAVLSAWQESRTPGPLPAPLSPAPAARTPQAAEPPSKGYGF